MVERRAVKILRTEEPAKFFSSGCALLDCVLGGGWARGKVINVVGDKSVGKSLLAVEAATCYVREIPNGKVVYIEAESAFDQDYARKIGLPDERVELIEDIATVEGFWHRVEEIIATNEPHLVIVDSLDALTDEAEVKREIGDATYGAAKSKLLSEGFRKLIRGMGSTELTLFVISQIRDKIGAPAFAKQVQRSGGRALDFYASQCLWIYQEGFIKKTVQGIERAIGVNIKARCEKNRLGYPWREAHIPILFGYGTDDVAAAVEWLAKASPETLPLLREGLTATNYKRHIKLLSRDKVAAVVKEKWEEIDREFRPERGKYDPV